jgi:hypothetical protein
MPGTQTSTRDAWQRMIGQIQQQLTQINSWIQTNPPGAVPSCTEATRSRFARKGQIVLVTDGSAGKHFQGYTGSEWVALG